MEVVSNPITEPPETSFICAFGIGAAPSGDRNFPFTSPDGAILILTVTV